MRRFVATGSAAISACFAISCAHPARASEPADEPSEEALNLFYTAYELFIEKSFPLVPAGHLSIQMYKDYPGPSAEDLEFTLSFIRRPGSKETDVRSLGPRRAPVVTQIYELATSQSFTDAQSLLAKLDVAEHETSSASCPAVSQIERSWQSDWLTTALPDSAEEQIIRLHPRVIRIAVRARNRTATLELTDPTDPAFTWGLEAVRAVQGCVDDAPAA